MHAQVENPKENKSRAAANSVAQKKSAGKQGLGFADYRGEFIAQRKTEEMANDNPQIAQPKALSSIINNGSKKANKMQAMNDNRSSQNQVIQGKLIYKGKIYSSLQEIAHGGTDVFDAYYKASDADKKSKLMDQNKLYNLETDLAEVSVDDLGGEQKQEMRKEASMSSILTEKLNTIAAENYGERCHEVATKMQDTFHLFGRNADVLEVYTGDPEKENQITVMGNLVRNHYITVVDGKVYDSSTGSNGIVLATYIGNLQALNAGKTLQTREVK